MVKIFKTFILFLSVFVSFFVNNFVFAKEKDKKERCYGIAKVGKNDCHSYNNSHSCAGLSLRDNDENEFLYIPSGLCEKIKGGILK